MSDTITSPLGIYNPGNCPAIYVACLASYNSGTLHGAWINLELAATAEDIRECIDYILKTSPTPGAEEYAVHDSQLLPGCLSSTEWPDLEELEEYAQTVCELSELEFAAYRIACDNAGAVLDEDNFRSVFYGAYDSEGEFCMEYYEEIGHELGPLESYIDWEDVWRGEFECNSWHSEFDKESGQYLIFSA